MNIRAGFSLRQYVHINSDVIAATIHEDVRLKGDNFKMVTYNKDASLSVWQYTAQSARFVRKQKISVKIEKIVFCIDTNSYILLTNQNSLIFMDNNLVETHRHIHEHTITCIEYYPDETLLFIGNESQVDCYTIQVDPHIRHQQLKLIHKYTIQSTVPLPLSFVFVEEKRKKLIIVNETSIRTFELSGLEKYSNQKLCRRAITCICYFEIPQLYVIGCADGSLFVINESLMILNKIQAHQGQIQTLRKHLNEPVVISVGADSHIRMHALHNLIEMFSYDLSCIPGSLEYLNDNSIAFYSPKSTGILEINTLTSPLLQLSSSIRILKSVKANAMSNVSGGTGWRLIAISEEGLVRFVSCQSGKVITSIMPKSGINAIQSITSVEATGISYLLMDNGDIWKFKNQMKPCKIEEIWKHAGNDTVTSLSTYKYNEMVFLLAATMEGSVLIFDSKGQVRLRFEAHTSPILDIYISNKDHILYIFTSDNQVKSYNLNPTHFSFMHLKAIKKLKAFPKSYFIMCERICFSGLDATVHVADLFLPESIEYSHERNHDHFEVVSCIQGHLEDKHFLSAGLDGQIKVWDLTNTLVCTINLRFPIRAMCFANGEGDLVLGLTDKLEILSSRAYRAVNKIKKAKSVGILDFDSKEDAKDEEMTNNDYDDVTYKTTNQSVKAFGIETLDARLSILNFVPPPNKQSEILTIDEKLLKLDRRISTSAWPTIRRVSIAPPIKSSFFGDRLTMSSKFALSLVNELEISPPLSPIHSILFEPSIEEPEVKIVEIVEPVKVHHAIAMDGTFPNSVYMQEVPLDLTVESEEFHQMKRLRKTMDEAKAVLLEAEAQEASKAYKDTMKFMKDHMKKTNSEEEIEERIIKQEEKTVTLEIAIAVAQELAVEAVVSKVVPPKKKAAGNYTKKIVPVQEIIVKVKSVEEVAPVVEVVKIPLTIAEILEEAYVKLLSSIDCHAKIALIKEMDALYGAIEGIPVTHLFLTWLIKSYESVIFGTSMDSWKLKMCFLNIMKSIDSPWFIPHIMFTMVDELEELRNQAEQVLLDRGLSGDEMHPFLKLQLFSIIHENAKRTDNSRLLRHVTTLLPATTETNHFTGNVLNDIQSFIFMRLQSMLCDGKDKAVALQVKNIPPPSLSGLANYKPYKPEGKVVLTWKSPAMSDVIEALNDYTQIEDRRLKRIEDEEAAHIQRDIDLRLMQEARKLSARLKKNEMNARKLKRDEEKALQAELRSKKLEELKIKRSDAAKGLVPIERVGSHSAQHARTGSPCHPSRETLEFVYRTLPPLQPGQTARKMTTMLSEQLRTMKNVFPMTKKSIQLEPIGKNDDDLESKKSFMDLHNVPKPVANFKKYFFIHQASAV